MNSKSFHQALADYPEAQLVFVGLGNKMRGDDRAGLEFLKQLKQSGLYKKSCMISAETNPENYLQQILDVQPRAVVIIDAAHFGEKPGTIRWLDQDKLDQMKISTHAFSMTMIEQYLNTHQSMNFHYLGIEPENTGFGTGLSQCISKSLETFFLHELFDW